MAVSKRAFDFAGSFGLGGGEGITGPPTAGLGPWPRGSSGGDGWTSWVPTTKDIVK